MRPVADKNGVESAGEVSRLTEHLFRHEAGKLVSVLTRIFGIDRWQLAEDVVQEALVRALQTWPYYGVPANPAAWLTRTAKNLALDALRRETNFRSKQNEIVFSMEGPWVDDGAGPEEIADDRLRMMFVCCHPMIQPEDQVALTLKTLCGFGSAEIARAFLTTETAIAKRLTRAKQRIRESGVHFEVPVGEGLTRRISRVLKSLYFLFNEGYKASNGDTLIRHDLCVEAVRLTKLLLQLKTADQPQTYALLALMLLNSARLSARTDDAGNLLRLQEQDRSLWDRSLIAEGMYHLAKSGQGDEASEYHLLAGIAACHCTAATHESTDWLRILELYDGLLELGDSPVAALNRAVAVAEVHGVQAGLQSVKAIRDYDSLESYYLLHAVLGDFEVRLQYHEAAARHFGKALELAEIETERRFLKRRLQECTRLPAPSMHT